MVFREVLFRADKVLEVFGNELLELVKRGEWMWLVWWLDRDIQRKRSARVVWTVFVCRGGGKSNANRW